MRGEEMRDSVTPTASKFEIVPPQKAEPNRRIRTVLLCASVFFDIGRVYVRGQVCVCVYHLIGLKTGFISIFRISRKLRMYVVYVHVCLYVLVRKRTFDLLDGLKLSSFDGFPFSRAYTFY